MGRVDEGSLEPELVGIAIGCGGHVAFAGAPTTATLPTVSALLYEVRAFWLRPDSGLRQRMQSSVVTAERMTETLPHVIVVCSG